MDCERFDKVTLDLLYAELDELSAAAARRHLHHCTRCQGIWSKLRATKDIAVVSLVDPPADLFESIILAERQAESALPLPQRFSRLVSIVAGYAMRPQLAMAALLLLMIGSSLLFVRQDPAGRDQVSVTELGAPRSAPLEAARRAAPVVVEGDGAPAAPAGAVDAPDAQTLPAAPPTTYSDAMAAYHEGRYAEAERLFGEVAAQGGEKAASAALHEGHAARNGSGCQRAARLYDAVAERFSGSTLSDEASWHAASCYQALGELGRARAHYLALKENPAFRERAGAALSSIDESLTNAALASRSETAPTAAAPDAEASSNVADASRADAKAAKAGAGAPSTTSASPSGASPSAGPARASQPEAAAPVPPSIGSH